jgi:hypothetical protein
MPPFTSTIIHEPDCVVIEGHGQAVLAHLLGLVDAAESELRERRQRLVVVDLADAEVTLSFTDRVHVAVYAARVIGGQLLRGAVVIRTEQRRHTMEMAARKMGMSVRVFATRESAVEWIRTGDPAG